MPPYSSKYGGFRKRPFMSTRRAYRLKQRSLRTKRAGFPKGRRALYRTGGFISMQTKFFDTALTSTAIPASAAGAGNTLDPAGGILSLAGIPQGVTESTRVGFQCIVKSIEINGVINIPAFASAVSPSEQTTVYIAVFQDTQTNGAQADSGLVYINPSGVASQCIAPLRNLAQTTRIKVLKTKMISFAPPPLATTAANFNSPDMIKPFKIFIKVNQKMKFAVGGTSGLIGTIEDNSWHLLAYTDSAATMAPTIAYNCRARFVDC